MTHLQVVEVLSLVLCFDDDVTCYAFTYFLS
jgi:hypothetical protein